MRNAGQTTATVPNGAAGSVTTMTITVRDGSGVAMSGAASGLAVVISGTNGGATPSSIVDNGNGTYTVTYTPAAAGTDSIAITLDGSAISGSPYASVVSAPAIAITTTTLPPPIHSVSYSQTVATSGGTAPVTFAISAGALPAGLTLNTATGTISGTPTTAGAYSFAVTATDANSGTATRTYTGTIGATLAITTASLPTPIIGNAYSQTVATSGGTAPVAFAITAGALPAGLTLNTTTGAITGTPTTPGAYSYTVTATDANAITSAQAYSGTISAGVAITTTTLPTPVLSLTYSQTIATTGGTAPVTFAVTSGTLPAGLSLNVSTGAVTGTPTTAGAYSFAVTATDASSTTSSQAYSGTIGAGLAITTATLPTPAIAAAYSQTVATSGGTAPITFAVTAGALPAGMTLNASTGAITGTPTASGAYSFTVRATDANATTSSQAYSGTIGAGLAITTATLPTPAIAAAYSQTVATSGGTAPITFAVTSGVLPAGLTLNAATGVITGTPTTPGAYSFTVRATDANATTSSQAYSGTIAAGLAITTTTLPAPDLGAAYAQTIATSGGAPSITFAVTSGALPGGLTLNTSTGVISGAANTAGAYSFAVTATDANGVTAARSYSGTIAQPPAPDPEPALPALTAADARIEVAYDTPGEVSLASSEAGSAFALAGAPSHGTVSIAGATATYVPAAGYIGEDSFTFSATAAGRSATGRVTITVAPPPPPTAESSKDQTIASGDGVDGNSTSTTAIDTATIDLTPLVKGIVTSVQIVAQPKHGTVTFETARAARSAMMLSTDAASPRRASAAAQVQYVAVYIPNRGYIGKDVFSFVAVGPGGRSAPAFVNIEVIPRAPTAKPINVASVGGRPVSVQLTSDEGGPLTGAAIVSKPALEQGETQLIESGPAGARTYTLTFRPNPSFEGSAAVLYTLTNSAGVSEPLSVAITVTARANPARDAEVRGLMDAETETARRFAGAQLDNFRDRMEAVRQGGGSGVRLVSGVTPSQAPESRQMSARQDPVAEAAVDGPGSFAAAGDVSSAPRRIGEIQTWVGGAISVGRRDAQTGKAQLKVSSSGLSAGADIALSPQITVGVGGGAGYEETKVGAQGSSVEADTWSVAAYASLRPMEGLFIDGVLGAGALDYSLRRYVAPGVTALGERKGDLTYGSLTAGLDRTEGSQRWSGYGRLEAVRADLDGFTERGADLMNLAYAARRIDSLIGVMGGSYGAERRTRFGLLNPYGRIEVQHDFRTVDAQTVHYADWMAGSGYQLGADGWARTRVSLGLGSTLLLESGWTLSADVKGELGDRQRLGAVTVGAATSF